MRKPAFCICENKDADHYHEGIYTVFFNFINFNFILFRSLIPVIDLLSFMLSSCPCNVDLLTPTFT